MRENWTGGHERHGPPSGAEVMCSANTAAHRHSQQSRKHYYAYTQSKQPHTAHGLKNTGVLADLKKCMWSGSLKMGNLTWKLCQTHLWWAPVTSLHHHPSTNTHISSNEGTRKHNHWSFLAKQPLHAQNLTDKCSILQALIYTCAIMYISDGVTLHPWHFYSYTSTDTDKLEWDKLYGKGEGEGLQCLLSIETA